MVRVDGHLSFFGSLAVAILSDGWQYIAVPTGREAFQSGLTLAPASLLHADEQASTNYVSLRERAFS